MKEGRSMRAVVLGAGAIGGWLAAGLARAGHDVGVLARGASLAALRADGLVLCEGDRRESFRVAAADDPTALSGPDVLVLGLKAQDLPGALPLVRALLGPGTPRGSTAVTVGSARRRRRRR